MHEHFHTQTYHIHMESGEHRVVVIYTCDPTYPFAILLFCLFYIENEKNFSSLLFHLYGFFFLLVLLAPLPPLLLLLLLFIIIFHKR